MSELYELPINEETAYSADYRYTHYRGLPTIAYSILRTHYYPRVQVIGSDATRAWGIFQMHNRLLNSLIDYIQQNNNREYLMQLGMDVRWDHRIYMWIPSFDEWIKTFLACASGYGASLVYNHDGLLTGVRYDGVNGVFFTGDSKHKGDYARNLDWTPIHREDFLDLVGTLFEEASNNGELSRRAAVNFDMLFKEVAALYCVIRNRARYMGWTLIGAASELDSEKRNYKIRGWGPRRDQINIYQTDWTANAWEDPVIMRTRCVIWTMLMVNQETNLDPELDYSNGGYFWDGPDLAIPKGIRGFNPHYWYDGVSYIDPDHNLFRLDLNPVYQLNEKNGKSWLYTYESTCAFGRTIFWKYSEERQIANDTKQEYP